MRQNHATANALATKLYEERLKIPLQRDALDDGAMKVSGSVIDSKCFYSYFIIPAVAY
jgi:hypothetical protein